MDFWMSNQNEGKWMFDLVYGTVSAVQVHP
jgi:hypothetical protein